VNLRAKKSSLRVVLSGRPRFLVDAGKKVFEYKATINTGGGLVAARKNVTAPGDWSLELGPPN